jgi:mono/diheme cytochrome c family protein
MVWDTPANLTLLKALLPLALCVHFACFGAVAGGASAAVAIDVLGTPHRRRGLAAAILNRLIPGPGAAALLGLNAALILLGVQSGYPPLSPSAIFWVGSLAPLPAGLALVAIYRRLQRQERGLPLRAGCGLAGIALVLASCFLLCCGSGVLVMPEKWPFLEAAPLLLLSWSGTARYLEFTCLSFVATGALIIFLGERMEKSEDAGFARRLGGGTALLFLLAWPPALLFTQFNLPFIALSGAVWLLAAAGLLTAAAGAWLVAGMPGQSERPRTRPLLAISLTLFALWVATDHLARENALDEATRDGLTAMLAPLPEAKKPAADETPLAGAAVFERVCAACHRFGEKLVGPPLDAVVPKYHDDPAALKAFLRNPVKRDPAYPAMPKLPLSEAEIEAVSAYLLKKAAP